jgi:glycosyltransferase involved in cell wall biosynthesis
MGIVKNIEEKYQESQLFLFTSKAEGFGMVLVEAQSNALPVVSYNCYSGPSDIIIENKGGYLIDMNDKTTFINRVTFLLKNHAMREQKSNEALINAKRFNASNVIPLWEKLFQLLID